MTITIRPLPRKKKEQQPALTWVPVTGPDGRQTLEMRWHVGQPARRQQAAAASAA